MRLTLRTLLALLDEAPMAPQDRQALQEKLQHSPTSAALIQRMTALAAQPRMASPAWDANGTLDPNHVAEYLDGTLPTQQVVWFEQACTKQDAALAEVGAVHQILCRMSETPVEVSPRLRDRLYSAQAEFPSNPALPIPLERELEQIADHQDRLDFENSPDFERALEHEMGGKAKEPDAAEKPPRTQGRENLQAASMLLSQTRQESPPSAPVQWVTNSVEAPTAKSNAVAPPLDGHKTSEPAATVRESDRQTQPWLYNPRLWALAILLLLGFCFFWPSLSQLEVRLAGRIQKPKVKNTKKKPNRIQTYASNETNKTLQVPGTGSDGASDKVPGTASAASDGSGGSVGGEDLVARTLDSWDDVPFPSLPAADSLGSMPAPAAKNSAGLSPPGLAMHSSASGIAKQADALNPASAALIPPLAQDLSEASASQFSGNSATSKPLPGLGLAASSPQPSESNRAKTKPSDGSAAQPGTTNPNSAVTRPFAALMGAFSPASSSSTADVQLVQKIDESGGMLPPPALGAASGAPGALPVNSAEPKPKLSSAAMPQSNPTDLTIQPLPPIDEPGTASTTATAAADSSLAPQTLLPRSTNAANSKPAPTHSASSNPASSNPASSNAAPSNAAAAPAVQWLANVGTVMVADSDALGEGNEWVMVLPGGMSKMLIQSPQKKTWEVMFSGISKYSIKSMGQSQRLAVRRCFMVLRSLAPNETFQITSPKGDFFVTALSPDAEMVIEIRTYLPAGFTADNTMPRFFMGCLGVSGKFVVEHNQREEVLTENKWLVVKPDGQVDQFRSPIPESIKSAIADLQQGRLTPEATFLNEAIAQEYGLTILSDTARGTTDAFANVQASQNPLQQVSRTEVEASSAEAQQQIELRSLAGIWSYHMGRMDPIVSILNDPLMQDHWESHIITVAGCLQSETSATAQLNRAFADQLMAQQVSQRFAGFNPQTIKKSQMTELVDDLGSDSLAKRVLAIYALKQLTGESYLYDPLGSPDSLQQSINRWRQWLDDSASARITLNPAPTLVPDTQQK